VASALALAHIEAERRIRSAMTQEVTRVWNGLPGHDRGNLDQWLSQVLPLVEAGQRSSVSMTQAFLAQSLSQPPRAVDPGDLIGAAVRNGTDPSQVYERPFIALWSELKEGKPYAEAAKAGLLRATGSAAMDPQLSMRATLGAVQGIEPRIAGYERVADAGACSFCLECDGAYMSSADVMPLHLNCGCGVEVIQGEPIETSPIPDGVEVVDHGELGPILIGPGTHFMDKSEALAR
jgi:hypothetical protein